MQDSRRQHIVPYTERVLAEACGGLGGGDVTRSTEVGFDGFALFINSTVHPLTAYLELGLVYAPGIADRPLVSSPAFVELWDVTYDQS